MKARHRYGLAFMLLANFWLTMAERSPAAVFLFPAAILAVIFGFWMLMLPLHD